jgi:Putative zinc-finger
MTDLELDRLRRSFHTGEIPVATADCLPAGTIAALADGTLPAERRGAALAHVATCASCRRAIASVGEALAAGPISHEIELVEGEGSGRRRFIRLFRIAVPLAAAAVVLVLLRSPAPEGVGGHRGGTDVTAPVPVAPVGTVATARVLVWTRAPGADGYRVTLFDADGRVAYETRATDTASTLPDSLVLVSGRPYLWKVEARVGFDRWVSSTLVEFSIATHSP